MTQPRRARYKVDITAAGVRIRIDGEIDLGVTDELQAAIAAAISAAGTSRAEVDLSEVTFLDSTGIRALVLAQRSAKDSGVALTVTGAHSRVKMVLELTGVYELLAG